MSGFGTAYQAPTINWSKSVVGTKSSTSPYGLQYTNRFFMKIPCLENPGRADQITTEMLKVNGVEQVTVDMGGGVMGVIMSTLVSAQYSRNEIKEWLRAAAINTGTTATFCP